MPILTASPIEVLDPSTPYQRLAFRGSLSASIVNGSLTDGNLALHITTYRKVGDEIEEVGSPKGVRGVTMSKGENAENDVLLARISLGCAESVLGPNPTAQVQVNFNWRARSGDIVGLVQATISSSAGDSINVACGDVAAWDQEYPQFAMAYGDALAALGEWIAAKGW